jgi:hypothetical protein
VPRLTRHVIHPLAITLPSQVHSAECTLASFLALASVKVSELSLAVMCNHLVHVMHSIINFHPPLTKNSKITYAVHS